MNYGDTLSGAQGHLVSGTIGELNDQQRQNQDL